jgi:hypothetical protein
LRTTLALLIVFPLGTTCSRVSAACAKVIQLGIKINLHLFNLVMLGLFVFRCR